MKFGRVVLAVAILGVLASVASAEVLNIGLTPYRAYNASGGTITMPSYTTTTRPDGTKLYTYGASSMAYLAMDIYVKVSGLGVAEDSVYTQWDLMTTGGVAASTIPSVSGGMYAVRAGNVPVAPIPSWWPTDPDSGDNLTALWYQSGNNFYNPDGLHKGAIVCEVADGTDTLAGLGGAVAADLGQSSGGFESTNGWKIGTIRLAVTGVGTLNSVIDTVHAGFWQTLDNNSEGTQDWAFGRTDHTGFTGKGDSLAIIPEPSTLALLACGLFGLLAYAWRKRK